MAIQNPNDQHYGNCRGPACPGFWMRDPINRRHANRQGANCPVFWRQFGNGLALFLALLPWAVLALHVVTSTLNAAMVHFDLAGNYPVASLFGTALKITNCLGTFPIVLWFFLIPPTLVFWWMMERAVQRGAVEKKRCHWLLFVWLAGGIAIGTVPYYLLHYLR